MILVHVADLSLDNNFGYSLDSEQLVPDYQGTAASISSRINTNDRGVWLYKHGDWREIKSQIYDTPDWWIFFEQTSAAFYITE